jgi:hypothetical protein
MLEKLATHGI